jgi:hypothetical protein
MKSLVMNTTFILSLLLVIACNPASDKANNNSSSEAFIIEKPLKEYWYSGKAEISSYELSQARYGELHKGKAVMVFVTEPFSKNSYTKADNPSDDNVSVMKLNFTKKFNTGIYPYSMMTSTFFPFEDGEQSLKISSSSQEWCGHTYMDMKNTEDLEFNINSYFEGESKENIRLNKTSLEDDIWTKIRLNPKKLITGETKLIPSFFYLRLMHKELKGYSCKLSKKKLSDSTTSYTLSYPELDRVLSIIYETTFPYRILSWEESYSSGWGVKKQKLKTEGKIIKTIKSDYWNKNGNSNSNLRKELGLE